MAVTKDEVFKKVQTALVDALGVDEEEVTPRRTMVGDLGAESIDFLDIVFQLEKAFGIEIPRKELSPEDILTNAEYVQDGKVTAGRHRRAQAADAVRRFRQVRGQPAGPRLQQPADRRRPVPLRRDARSARRKLRLVPIADRHDRCVGHSHCRVDIRLHRQMRSMRWFWIDRFTEFESGQRAVAIKNVALSEEQLDDHLPGFPVMPNSLIIEGMAQTGGPAGRRDERFQRARGAGQDRQGGLSLARPCPATRCATRPTIADVQERRRDGHASPATSATSCRPKSR